MSRAKRLPRNTAQGFGQQQHQPPEAIHSNEEPLPVEVISSPILPAESQSAGPPLAGNHSRPPETKSTASRPTTAYGERGKGEGASVDNRADGSPSDYEEEDDEGKDLGLDKDSLSSSQATVSRNLRNSHSLGDAAFPIIGTCIIQS